MLRKQRHNIHTATHWGGYEVAVENGKVVGVRGHSNDPDPSPIGRSLIEAQEHPVRIAQPMIRKGWLEKNDDNSGRGVEPFVPVSWEEATERVAAELVRVKETYGNPSIYAISKFPKIFEINGKFSDASLTESSLLCPPSILFAKR